MTSPEISASAAAIPIIRPRSMTPPPRQAERQSTAADSSQSLSRTAQVYRRQPPITVESPARQLRGGAAILALGVRIYGPGFVGTCIATTAGADVGGPLPAAAARTAPPPRRW